MTMKTKDLEALLAGRGYEYVFDPERAWLVVSVVRPGVDKFVVVVTLEEEGRFLKIFTPRLFVYPDGPHKLALMQTMLFTCWETKMLQWEYDPADGEVRAMVEFPLEDNHVTEAQFFRAFEGLIELVAATYPRVKAVIETGTDPGRTGSDTSFDRLVRDFLDFSRHRDKPVLN
jgi:hypothetical protein